MPSGDPWTCPFCAIPVPPGTAHTCHEAALKMPQVPIEPPRSGGLVWDRLTEQDVRRIVREELALRSERKDGTS